MAQTDSTSHTDWSPEVEVTGLCIVRPGTALVVRTRGTREVRSVHTHGRVLVWPWWSTALALDLASFTVLATASGEGAARTADGLHVDVTLRLTLRPLGDEASVRAMVTAFGVPPEPIVVAERVVEALSPALATVLARVPGSALRPSLVLPLPATGAHGFDLERVEVLHVGDARLDPSGGYRGGEVELDGVRFEGRPVAPPSEPSLSPASRKAHVSAPTWAQADTSQRVIVGWLIVLTGVPVGALMAAAHGSWWGEALFVLALCALANVLIHLKTFWCLPPAVLSVYLCVRVANAPDAPLPTLLPAIGLWLLAVLLFARNPPSKARKG
jgi:hypothetical protein